MADGIERTAIISGPNEGRYAEDRPSRHRLLNACLRLFWQVDESRSAGAARPMPSGSSGSSGSSG